MEKRNTESQEIIMMMTPETTETVMTDSEKMLKTIMNLLNDLKENNLRTKLKEKDEEILSLKKKIVELEKIIESKNDQLKSTQDHFLSVQDSMSKKSEEGLADIKGLLQQQKDSATISLLHNKVDKLVRIFVESSENQKKIIKMLSSLEKKTTNDEVSKSDEVKPMVLPHPPEISSAAENKNLRKFNEFRWGNNLCLVGDELWKSFQEIQDIETTVKKNFTEFRILCKDGENIFRLFDEKRGQILIPLPQKCFKIGISIGAQDLRESSFLTLKDASLEELRQKNYPLLRSKALNLKSMINKLIGVQNYRTVILVIPPYGDDRVEIHQHWEEVIYETMRTSLPFPKLKILNLPSLMKKSRLDFADKTEYLRMWFSSPPGSRNIKLAPYGARRLFEELRNTILSRHPSHLGMGGDWPMENPPSLPQGSNEKCPRCTKPHSNWNQCKAIDKLCRRCGIIGHFVEVHDVTDSKFQEFIVETLGLDLYNTNPPLNKVPRLEAFNDWYI